MYQSPRYQSPKYPSSQSCSPLLFSTAIAGAGAAIFLFATVLVGADHALAQSARSIQPAIGSVPGVEDLARLRPPIMPEIKSILEPGDDIAALQAIDVALTQASDGATYVWRHGNGRLNGAVHMTRTFRDADGRICRHLQMTLAAGTYSRQREGIACRDRDGRWAIEG